MVGRRRRWEAGPVNSPRRPVIAVIGGGISGLVAAWRLRDQAEVVVLEQSARFGGKLRVEQVGGITVDVGAESMLARRPEGVGLIRELGMDADLTHPTATAANVVRDGRLFALPAATVLGVPSDVATLPGLLTPAEVARVGAEPVGQDWADHDDLDVAAWVGGRLGQAVVDRLVEPLLGGVYAGQARFLSARATLPALWARTHGEHPVGSLLAAARATLAAGTAGGRSAAGSAGAGSAGGGTAAAPSPVFVGLRGGVGRLPGELAAQLAAAGVQLRTGVTARALRRAGTRWRLTLGPVPAPEYLDVDAVVLAVPAPAAAKLLADENPYAAADLAQIEVAGVAVVVCVLAPGQAPELPGSGVLVPPIEGRAVKAMTFSSAKWQWLADSPEAGGEVVVRLSVGRHREPGALQCSDEELVEIAVADAADLLGPRFAPRATRVVRWGGGLPQYAVGHVDRIARVRSQLAGLPGVGLCGAAMDGVGIPACIAAADAAAAKVLADLVSAAQTGG